MSWKNLIVALLVIVLLGAGGGLGYKTYKLTNERDCLLEEVAGLERKNSLLAGKNARERARVSRCAAARARVESRLREAEDRIVALEKKNETTIRLSQELKIVKGKLEKEINRYRQLLTRNRKAEQSRDKFASELKDLKQLHREKMAEYEAKVNDLSARLNSSNRRLARCREHNARLCVIGDNLAVMIQEKGGGLIREPIFQAGRIEIEKMAQEYLEEIDKLKEKR